MKPKEYHWNDVGAPELKTNKGDIYTIFKACLITGYGNKAGAGWKLHYDGFVAKGEQKIAFSVADETEQEIIFFLEDTHEFSGNNYTYPNARLTMWSNFDEQTNTVQNRLGGGGINEENVINYDTLSLAYSQSYREKQPKEWHFYATNKFALFFYETYQNDNHIGNSAQHAGEFIAFGAVRDLFGEFLPQLIIGSKRGIAFYASKFLSISSGGVFYLPHFSFTPSSDKLSPLSSSNFQQHNNGIFYHLPILLSYQPNDSQLPSSRLFVPSLVISPSTTLAMKLTDDWLQIHEKNGYKIATLSLHYFRGSISFDLTEWDNPAWLNQIING